MLTKFADYRHALASVKLSQRVGVVSRIRGLCIESTGPEAAIGELCRIWPSEQSATALMAEVVGVAGGQLSLMPYGPLQGIRAGCRVVADGAADTIGVGEGLLGRVIDGFGRPLDSLPAPQTSACRSLKGAPINPLQRPPIRHSFQTGVRSIDCLLTLGQGQRIGIFAGSGVGKSTLLGMITRHAQADLNVIALIGERGREVREFIEQQLGSEGLARSVVVVATADQPALARVRAAYAALAIAEFFRASGKQVLLTMDSVTRFAMARREVGLAAGEPPSARAYTPSVFAELPELCERCGTDATGGSITGLLTVLVEGDDFNEPVADHLRAALDGHIVLTRELAHQGQYPAIDLLQSISRLMSQLVTPEQNALAATARRHLVLLARHRPMVDIGAYQAGSNPALDAALVVEPVLLRWLTQSEGGVLSTQAWQELAHILAAVPGQSV